MVRTRIHCQITVSAKLDTIDVGNRLIEPSLGKETMKVSYHKKACSDDTITSIAFITSCKLHQNMIESWYAREAPGVISSKSMLVQFTKKRKYEIKSPNLMEHS